MIKEYVQQYWILFIERIQEKYFPHRKKEYYRQIWILAIPLLMENTLQTFLGTVDRYFASSLDDSAIAAIGITEIVTNLYLVMFTAINLGVSVILGKNIGQNNMKQANEAARQGIILSTVMGIAIGLLSLVLGRQFILYTGCTEEIFSHAVPYFMAVAVPSVLLSLSLTVSACLRATKDTKTPMLLTSLCNVLNIFLNIVFINLDLGMFGIGLATSISRLLLTMGLFAVLLSKNQGIHLHFRKYKVNLPVLKEITTLALPAGGEKLAMRTGQLCYTAMILSLGTEAYVAHTLTATIENYIYIPILAFATTTSILVSISLGEGNPEKANDYVSILTKINSMVLTVFSLVFVLFGKHLINIFTDSPQAIADTYNLLLILACTVPFMGALQLYTSALQGSGDSKTPMYSTLLGIWLIRFGGGFFFCKVLALGISGFWTVLFLDVAIRSMFLYTVYQKNHKATFTECLPLNRKVNT